MGAYPTLPLKPDLCSKGATDVFTMNVAGDPWRFELGYNARGAFWVLAIAESGGTIVHRNKVAYGLQYSIKDATGKPRFVVAFFDPQGREVDVTTTNLGVTVIGAVGALA